MNTKRIKIDCDQIVDTLSISMEISKLTCKICCYLLINPKICYNKKCGQVYCSDCIKTSSDQFTQTPCPFCNLQCDKMKFSSSNIDPNLTLVLKNVKVICKHIDCRSTIIPLNEYLTHITIDKPIEKSKCFGRNCDSDWKQLKQCAKCSLISCRKCDMLYYINWEIQCRKCIEKNSSDLMFDKQAQINCKHCNTLIKVMTNPFLVAKCSVCLEIYCSKCILMCPICKQDTCLKCFESCSQCNMSNNNSHLCLTCYKTNIQLGLFHKCTTCNRKYCLNCVSTCNVCHITLCCDSKNKTKCFTCDDNVCSRHLYSCPQCSIDKKVCLKQCTYTCQICLQKSTSYCNENNHPVLSQSVLSCSHQLCTKCVERCSSCKTEHCQLCNTKKMFRCNICNSSLCDKCTNFCYKCYTSFCVFHKCIVCFSLMEDCFSCYVKECKLICQLCTKDLDDCEDCIKKCICSYKCYMKYCGALKDKEGESISSSNSEHCCPMFLCIDCQLEQSKRHDQCKRNNNRNKGDNNNNNEEDNSIVNEDNESYYISRSRKKIDESDKVMIACQESCICIIY